MSCIPEGPRETHFSSALRRAKQLHEATEAHLADVTVARHLMEETADLVRRLEPKPKSADPPALVDRATPGTSSPITCDLASVFDDMTKVELAELAERLLTACATAVGRYDDAQLVLLRAALFHVGRLIAGRLGPKAAGVRLN